MMTSLLYCLKYSLYQLLTKTFEHRGVLVEGNKYWNSS
jgi:hypothetical protein